MEMENLFKKSTDDELKIYFFQYNEWRNTGIIPDNELGKMRDYYYSKLGVNFHVVMMQYLLESIAERWVKN